MNRLLILYKKEIKQLFLSFVSFFSIILFPLFAVIWTFFIFHFFNSYKADLSGFFGFFPTLFILFIPILTMKSWFDDRKYKTDELLLTMPFSEKDIILSKYFSVLTIVLFMFLLSSVVPISLFSLGRFDKGKIVCSFIGLFLYASASVSISLFINCFVGGSLISWLFSAALLIIMSGSVIEKSSIFSLLSFSFHMESFSSGILSLSDTGYFLILIILPLYLSSRLLWIRRWN